MTRYVVFVFQSLPVSCCELQLVKSGDLPSPGRSTTRRVTLRWFPYVQPAWINLIALWHTHSCRNEHTHTHTHTHFVDADTLYWVTVKSFSTELLPYIGLPSNITSNARFAWFTLFFFIYANTKLHKWPIKQQFRAEGNRIYIQLVIFHWGGG